MSTPAGLPWRVITTSCVSASRRKRDKSSLTSERGTSFIFDFRTALAMARPPIWGRSPVPRTRNIVEHTDLLDAEPVLRSRDTAQTLNSASARLRWFVPQMGFEGLLYRRPFTNALLGGSL